MRTIKYIFLALVALALVTVGFANRQSVTLTLFPEEFVPFTKFNAAIDLPLYAVVFGGVALGLLLGFVWEWLREAKLRSEGVQNRRERARLTREVQKLKADKPEGKDEILALVDDRKPAA